jgi:tetratricopeptide (TPR) repeat protein
MAPRPARALGIVALAAAALLNGCAPPARTAAGPASGAAAPPARTITSPAALALMGRVPPPGIQTAGEARTLASATPAAVGAVDQGALLPMDDAVTRAAEALFANAQPSAAPGSSGRHALVIDPLIDGATGAQSAATRSVQARVAEVALRDPRFDLRPFNTASLEAKPLVLLGSMMPLRPGNAMVGAPTAFDLWLVLADMRTGRVVGRSEAPMRVAGVDPTPTPFFRDSPVWVKEDPTQRGYWETCRSVVGDAVDPRYLEGIFASALVADGIAAYEAGRPWQALAFYQRAARLPAGDQTRVHNGLYLANWAVGRRDEAEAAFAQVVDLGLRQGQLAVKLVFQPGSTAFWPDQSVSGPYPIWVRRIARGAVVRETCLEVTGHTSPTGAPALNDRLSLQRAQRVQGLLVRSEPPLARRTAAKGAGSRDPIIGTGSDDASDALDRRVEFAPQACGAVAAAQDDPAGV